MVYAVTPMGVYSGKTLSDLNKALGPDIELLHEDFKFVGPDQIVMLNGTPDIDFVQDRKKLSSIMFHNFFRKDPRPTLFFLIQITVTAVLLIMNVSMLSILKDILAAFGVGG